MITAQEIATALHAKRIGTGWVAKCPIHGDEHESLKISDGTDGRPLIHCNQPTCELSQKENVPRVMKNLGLWTKSETKRVKLKDREIAAYYNYYMEDGTPVCQAVRFNPKGFAYRRPKSEHEWIWNLEGVNAPLYHAPSVKKAREAGETILLVEGEKDADNAQEHFKVTATTNIGGAGKWKPAYTEALKGAKLVVMLPDNDAAGEQHVQIVAPQLKAAGITVKVVRLPDLQQKGDVTDWINKGGTKKQLEKLIEEATEWDTNEIRALEGTELSAARSFIKLYGDELYHTPERGWYAWDGKRYVPDERKARMFAEKAVTQLKNYELALKMQSSKGITNCLNLAMNQPDIAISINDFDTQPDLLNCANGVLDLRDGECRPHDRDLRMSRLVHVKYDIGAKCPEFNKFLNRIMDGDKDMIDYLWRALGYTLTGHTSEQVLFFCYGNGANGKSVFLETIQAMLSEYSRTINKSVIMHKEHGDGIPNAIARLVQARYVLVSELAEGERFDEGLLKDLTGEDTITARFLRKEFFDFRPQFKPWLRGNHKPQIKGNDYGIWRRIHLIPFEVQIPEKERDKNLKPKLMQELSGILARAVMGNFDWRENGLLPPPKVQKAVKDYREEMDIPGNFLDEMTIRDTEKWTRAGVIYHAYVEWCKDCGYRPMSITRFSLTLQKRNVPCDRDTNNYAIYKLELHSGDIRYERA